MALTWLRESRLRRLPLPISGEGAGDEITRLRRLGRERSSPRRWPLHQVVRPVAGQDRVQQADVARRQDVAPVPAVEAKDLLVGVDPQAGPPLEQVPGLLAKLPAPVRRGVGAPL